MAEYIEVTVSSEVMASTVRPGMTSAGQKSDAQPTSTNRDEGMNEPRTWMRLRRRRTSRTLMQDVLSERNYCSFIYLFIHLFVSLFIYLSINDQFITSSIHLFIDIHFVPLENQ